MPSRCLFASFLLICAGCSRPNPTPVQVGKEGDITIQDAGVNIKMSKQGGSAEIHKGFPADVPIYPGSKVEASVMIQKNHQVTLSTPDPFNKVYAFYEEKLAQNGWKEEAKQRVENGGTIAAKKNMVTCGIIFATDEDKTTIHLTVFSEKQ